MKITFTKHVINEGNGNISSLSSFSSSVGKGGGFFLLQKSVYITRHFQLSRETRGTAAVEEEPLFASSILEAAKSGINLGPTFSANFHGLQNPSLAEGEERKREREREREERGISSSSSAV